MITRLAATAAIAALVLTPLAASASSPGVSAPDRDAAIDACVAFNEAGPARLVDVVADGLGDYFVWVEDGRGALWACNASSYGDVFANVRIGGDLLDGKGLSLIQRVADTGWASPGMNAEKVCAAMAGERPLTVVATVADALGGYVVWLGSEGRDLVMCNANAKGEVFAFEDVDAPINVPGLDGVLTG